MSYPKEIHEQAHKLLSQQRDKNRQESARREALLAKELPEAGKLLRELTATSAKLVRIIAAGGDINRILPQLREENLSTQKVLSELLKSHGYPANYLEPIYSCDICKDSGFVGSETCDCLKQILRNLTYQKLGVPRHLENCSFENFSLNKYSSDKAVGSPFSPRQQMESVHRNCMAYAENFSLASANLYMFGDPGLGKTHLSIAIAKKVIEKGYDVMYIPFYNLVSRLEAAKFGRSDESFSELLSSVNGAELLILDDLGAEFPSQFVISTLYDIVNTRMLEGKPTVINSNLSVMNLEERYTNRIASRISGTYRLARFTGVDIRYQNAQRKEG